MLRTQPPEVYDKWVSNEIPFTDPACRERDRGPSAGSRATTIGCRAVPAPSPPPTSATAPRASSHRRRSATCTARRRSSRPSSPKAPRWARMRTSSTSRPIEVKDLGKPVLGAGTLMGDHQRQPRRAMAFIEFLQTPIAHEVWMAQKGFLTPHTRREHSTPIRDVRRSRHERDPAERHHLPLRRLRPDARRRRRRGLLDRHGRLCRRQAGARKWPDPEAGTR
jgi:alpha-glucoside transport system substrate-binding protein